MLLDVVGDTESSEALRSECPYPSLVGPFPGLVTHALTAIISSFPVWQSARCAPPAREEVSGESKYLNNYTEKNKFESRDIEAVGFSYW